MLQVTGTSRIDRVHGLAGRLPLLAGCAGAGVLALTGFPLFSFASEIGIARAGFSAGLGWGTAPSLALMLVITAALLSHAGRMLLGAGPPADGTPHGSAAGHGGRRAGRVRRARHLRRAARRPTAPRRPHPHGNAMTIGTGTPGARHVTSRRTVTPAELAGEAESLLGTGFRLALAAGHEDDGRLRAVYLFTAPRPDREPSCACRWTRHGRGSPAWPGCRSRSAGSNARCATCSASCPTTTR